MQKLGQCPRFGVQALRAALGLGERTAGDLERLAGGGMRGFRAHGRCFRVGGGRLRRFRRLGQRRQIRARLGGDLRQLRFHRGDFVSEARRPIAVLAHGAVQRIAPRGQIGERRGEFVGGLFRARQHGVGLRDRACRRPRAVRR